MIARQSRQRFLVSMSVLGTSIAVPWTAVRAADTYTMRLSSPQAADDIFSLVAIQFASALKRRSNGQLNVEVYPNAQLAKQQETIDALQTGVIDFTVQASTDLVPQFPHFQAFDMPYVFKNLAAAYRVIDGPIGAELSAELAPKGLLALAWGTAGTRELETTSKAVQTPEDIKGLRIRIQPSPINVATYQALGAIPVPVDISEVFVALQQRTVDGLEIPPIGIYLRKLYTVIKHIALTNSISTLAPLLASKRKVEMLPVPLQNLIKDQGRAMSAYWRTLAAQQDGPAIAGLKQNGVVFTEIQYAAFRKAVEPVYATFQSKIGGDLLERVLRAAG